MLARSLSTRPAFTFLIPLLGMLAVPAASAVAQDLPPNTSFHSQFIDTLDHKFDVSKWVLSRYGFILVPSIITEPAVGVGIAGALVFLKQHPHVPGQRRIPPNVTGFGAAYTSNDTWLVGGGHIGYWRQDRVRYKGLVGFTALNLAYYGESSEGVDFGLDGFATLQELTFRLGESQFFAGGQYVFANSSVEFDSPGLFPGVSSEDLDSRIGGLGGLLAYDSRDNTFTPNRGGRAQVLFRYFAPAFASDWEYRRLDVFGYSNASLSKSVTLGFRADLRIRFDDAPFYTLPYIDLRGIPAMRYQGEEAIVFETEGRWDFSPRWSVVGFAGMGGASSVDGDLSSHAPPAVYTAGAGIRYLIARLLGIRMGVDIARGPEDWALYVQFGSAWARY